MITQPHICGKCNQRYHQ